MFETERLPVTSYWGARGLPRGRESRSGGGRSSRAELHRGDSREATSSASLCSVVSRPCRAVVGAVVVITGLCVTACGSAHTSATRATPPHAAPSLTQVEIFTGASLGGTPTVTITSRPAGSCWEGSLATPRSEAWRCTLVNEIKDPCFTSGVSTLVCPEGGPWTGAGIEIRLTQPLPRERENTGHWPSGEQAQPWALQLTDGSHCELMGGATGTVNGMRLHYECRPDQLALYGNPDRSAPVWTIYGGALNASQLTKRTIAIAWF